MNAVMCHVLRGQQLASMINVSPVETVNHNTERLLAMFEEFFNNLMSQVLNFNLQLTHNVFGRSLYANSYLPSREVEVDVFHL